MIDSRDVKELHPTLQRGIEELKRRMPSKYRKVFGISSTYRSNKKQQQLYNQGRTTKGKIITNAPAGMSMHNYRLAFDIFVNIKGKEYVDREFFNTIGKIWEDMGGVWGGSWTTFTDRPHLEFSNGLTVRNLKGGDILSNNVKMKWEVDSMETRYNTLDEMPEWAKPTIQKLIDDGKLSGNNKGLDLSLDMIRLLVIMN